MILLSGCAFLFGPTEEQVSEAYDAFSRGLNESLEINLGPVTWDGRAWDECLSNLNRTAFIVLDTTSFGYTDIGNGYIVFREWYDTLSGYSLDGRLRVGATITPSSMRMLIDGEISYSAATPIYELAIDLDFTLLSSGGGTIAGTIVGNSLTTIEIDYDF